MLFEIKQITSQFPSTMCTKLQIFKKSITNHVLPVVYLGYITMIGGSKMFVPNGSKISNKGNSMLLKFFSSLQRTKMLISMTCSVNQAEDRTLLQQATIKPNVISIEIEIKKEDNKYKCLKNKSISTWICGINCRIIQILPPSFCKLQLCSLKRVQGKKAASHVYGFLQAAPKQC